MNKRLLFLCIGLMSLLPFAKAQEKLHATINYGIKAGFNSTLIILPHLQTNGQSINEVQNNYKIGYLGALFMRINFDRHFVQPELSYNISRGDMSFEQPSTKELSIESTLHSIDVPILYGYNIIKEDPYGMAIFAGPKMRFLLNKPSEVEFHNFDGADYSERLRTLTFSATLGVAVTISPIFFDFRYDIGLHNISRRIKSKPTETPSTPENTENIAPSYHRRDNVLSFSFGVLF